MNILYNSRSYLVPSVVAHMCFYSFFLGFCLAFVRPNVKA